MATLASDWLRHFRLLWRNRWTEFNETWQEVSSQCLLYHICVFQANQEKTKWPTWPLIGWHILDFSSETAERNSTKLDRKQDLNALYQVCVFQVDRKNKMAAPVYDLLRHFQLFLWNRWIEFNKTWRKQDPNILYQACVFRADQKKKIAALSSDWMRHFRLLLWNHRTEFNETRQKASSQRPLPNLCFRADPKNNMAALASDWLRHILTFLLKPLNGIQRNLTGSKILTSSTKFVFVWPKSE